MKHKWHSFWILTLTLLLALTQPVQAAKRVTETITKQSADVTGDKVPDQLTLTGTKRGTDDIYYTSFTISVKDGASGKVYNALFPEGYEGALVYGYEAKLLFCDLNGDRVKDVIMHVATGGSGGTSHTFLYTFAGGIAKPIATPKPLKLTGKYVDNYRVVIKIEGQKEQMIDLKDRKQTYDESGVYRNGKLLKPYEIWVLTYEILKPVDLDGDGVCELVGNQRVSGTSNSDPIAYVNSQWKWKQGKWQRIGVSLKPLR